MLGTSGGLVPCPTALAVLLTAVAVGRVGLGLVLILALSLGLATTLVGIGLAFAFAMPVVTRRGEWGFTRYVPLGSAIVVLSLGIFMTVKAVLDVAVG
jgi:ABC-type nickel/cobalt efflux system permease component RcnA